MTPPGARARVSGRRSAGTRRPHLLGEAVVVGLLALYAAPVFWQLLTSLKPEAELLALPPLLPSRLTGSTTAWCSSRARCLGPS